jgi:ABC-2 type transport system ATP-binding protein
MDAIEVDHLTKKFGDLVAVNDISFTVARGEIFGLLGPNGAGKTTLIRMMTTLTPPSSGTARIGGHDIVKDADGVRQVLGVIPQAFTSDPELTARENMLIHAKLYGVPSDKRAGLINELLESVDLLKFRDSLVRTFSGGMRRRLEIARGLIHSPEILFLDEPTTGLDPVSRTNVWEMIRTLRSKSDLTILITTHYMDEADKLCDRIAIVDHGKLVALDSPLKLKASIPGKNVLEVSFSSVPPNWEDALRALPEVAEVKADEHVFRIASHNGPVTTVELVAAARRAGVAIASLSVQSTTLDDVFVHYTGHQLRDALQTPDVSKSPFMLRSR